MRITMGVNNNNEERGNNVLRVFENMEDLATDLCDYVSKLLKETLKERGGFCNSFV